MDPARKRPIGLIVAGELLVLVYGGMVSARLYEVPNSAVLGLMMCSWMMTVILVAGFWGKWQGPWATSFILFVVSFLLFAPASQLASGEWPATALNPPIQFFGLALGVLTVGVISWSVSYRFGARPQDRKTSTIPEMSTFRRKRMLGLLFICAVVLLLYINQVGLGPLLATREDLDVALGGLSDQRFLTAILRSLATVPPAVVVGVRLLAPWRPSPWFDRVLLVLVVVLLACAVNPISSPRIFVGFIWGGVLLCVCIRAGSHRVKAWQAYFVAGFLYLFPLADFFRNSNRSTIGLKIFDGVFQKGDFDSFAQILNAIECGPRVAPKFGEQFLGVVLFWIPRSVWQGKPQDSAILLAQCRGYRQVNISAPLWAEGWLNGSWIGVVLMLGAFGYVCGRLDSSIWQASSLQGVIGTATIVAAFGAPYSLILLRGSLLQAVSVFVSLVVSAIVVTRICVCQSVGPPQGSVPSGDEDATNGGKLAKPTNAKR